EHNTFGGVLQGVVEVNAVTPPRVTVRIDDNHGGSDTQSYTINVSSSPPGEIHGTKFNDLNGDGLRNATAEYIYWSDDALQSHNTDHIKRANLDGSNIQTIMTQPNARFAGIAFDTAHGYMYSGDNQFLFRANLDGSGRVNLVSTGG